MSWAPKTCNFKKYWFEREHFLSIRLGLRLYSMKTGNIFVHWFASLSMIFSFWKYIRSCFIPIWIIRAGQARTISQSKLRGLQLDKDCATWKEQEQPYTSKRQWQKLKPHLLLSCKCRLGVHSLLTVRCIEAVLTFQVQALLRESRFTLRRRMYCYYISTALFATELK